jgi:hypothetical protein
MVNNLNERWNLSEQDKHERARKCAAFDREIVDVDNGKP